MTPVCQGAKDSCTTVPLSVMTAHTPHLPQMAAPSLNLGSRRPEDAQGALLHETQVVRPMPAPGPPHPASRDRRTPGFPRRHSSSIDRASITQMSSAQLATGDYLTDTRQAAAFHSSHSFLSSLAPEFTSRHPAVSRTVPPKEDSSPTNVK